MIQSLWLVLALAAVGISVARADEAGAIGDLKTLTVVTQDGSKVTYDASTVLKKLWLWGDDTQLTLSQSGATSMCMPLLGKLDGDLVIHTTLDARYAIVVPDPNRPWETTRGALTAQPRAAAIHIPAGSSVFGNCGPERGSTTLHEAQIDARNDAGTGKITIEELPAPAAVEAAKPDAKTVAAQASATHEDTQATPPAAPASQLR